MDEEVQVDVGLDAFELNVVEDGPRVDEGVLVSEAPDELVWVVALENPLEAFSLVDGSGILELQVLVCVLPRLVVSDAVDLVVVFISALSALLEGLL